MIFFFFDVNPSFIYAPDLSGLELSNADAHSRSASKCKRCAEDAQRMSYYYTPRKSRLSARPRARESIFPGGSELHREGSQPSFSPDLLESVRAMEDCCEEASKDIPVHHPNRGTYILPYPFLQAHEAQQLLRNGTFDLPRMAHVLDNQRVQCGQPRPRPHFQDHRFL